MTENYKKQEKQLRIALPFLRHFLWLIKQDRKNDKENSRYFIFSDLVNQLEQEHNKLKGENDKKNN